MTTGSKRTTVTYIVLRNGSPRVLNEDKYLGPSGGEIAESFTRAQAKRAIARTVKKFGPAEPSGTKYTIVRVIG